MNQVPLHHVAGIKNDVLKLKIVLFEIFGFRQGNINTCYLYNASPSPKKSKYQEPFRNFFGSN